MRNIRKLFAILLLTTSLPAPARAQNSDLDVSQQNAARLEVRLSAMEEQMRDLQGKIEENNFQIKRLTDTLDKMQRDTDFRFNELAEHASATVPPVSDGGKPKKVEIVHERKPLNTNMEASVSEPKSLEPGEETTAGNGVLEMPEAGATTPRDQYNTAIRLFNQNQYDEAATSFESFTKSYPSDPLIGNAYFWLGDTYYKRHDYVNAADNFRQGFEALPTGPKAADNLLKLAMSLDALKRDKEACVVLRQVVTKFKTSSTSVTQKAAQEQARIGCQ